MKAHIPDEIREGSNNKISAWILRPPVTLCMFLYSDLAENILSVSIGYDRT